MKVLYCASYGGFGFSETFWNHLANKFNFELNANPWQSVPTDDNTLAEEAIAFGLKEASGDCCRLAVEEIPDELSYYKSEYDGSETVHTYYAVTEEELLNGLSKDQIDLVKKATEGIALVEREIDYSNMH
jgi:hypothetical protein